MKRGRRVVSMAFAILMIASAASAQLGTWWLPLADDFLGNADFVGFPILGPPIVAGTQSTYNGFLTIANVDRALVASVLPPGFVLATNLSWYHGNKHPVLMLFGDQTDGAMFTGNVVTPAFPLDRGHYSELILAIPYVRPIGVAAWHTYIVRMYLDNPIAVAGGALYGYAKEHGCLEWRGTDVEVRQRPTLCPNPDPVISQDLLEGDFWHVGPWHDGPAAAAQIPNFSDMVGMVTARLLGKGPLGNSICSYFEWDFSNAKVAKAATSHRFLAPFRPNMTAWPALGTLNNVTDGAIEVRGLRWRLGPTPVACGFP